ncbi:MAG TPA: mannosyltransferase family protein [Candidatus Polarisedimenticolia bacterium]|nr:mannosyltransferase family protein [Candidatus Polarisedimenticolia bacterium]
MPALSADEASRRPLPYRQIAFLLIASRLALLAVGTLSTWLLPSGLSVQKGNLVYHQPAPRPLEIWARWDSEWYLMIAERGYDVGERLEGYSVGYEPEAAAGFLPLYPLLVRTLASCIPFVGSVGSGVLVSNLSLFGALLILYRLTAGDHGGRVSHQAGLAACAALLLFPMSLFLSAVYAESLFLLLALATLALAGRGRFAAAGGAAGLAALTRPFGATLAVPIFLEWWIQRRDAKGAPAGARLQPGAWAWCYALAAPAGLGLFLIYCGKVFSDPMAFFHRQTRWRGGMSGPWRAFARWWESGPVAHGAHGSTLELIIAIVFLAMLPAIIKRMRGSHAAYAVLLILLPLCSTLWSFGRFALTAFPAFMLIGTACAEGRRRLPALYAVMGATLSGLLMALFANWWWAG